MSEASSRIEGPSGVHAAARAAEQRMQEMLAEAMNHGSDRTGTEARSAIDQLRKDVDDRLRAASRTAGSDRSDPAAMVSDPTTLPSAMQGHDAAPGVMAQLQTVLQRAVMQQLLGDASLQLAAAALLDTLAHQAAHVQPLAAATGSPVLTAGDNGNNAGGGFMPGNQPWLQLPESFSTRSVLPDVAAKSNADGSLNSSNGDGSGAARERSLFVRAVSAHAAGATGAAPAGALDAARHLMNAFGLSALQAAGLAAVAMQGMNAGGSLNAPGAIRAREAARRRFPGGSVRRQRLFDFALLQELDPESPQTALAFIEHELRDASGDRLAALRSAGSAQQVIEILLRGQGHDGEPWTDDALVQSILRGIETPPLHSP